MNIDDLTIGQAKELSSLFGAGKSASTSRIYDSIIGEYVIVRSRNEGVNAGVVVAADETGIILADARRLHAHTPADESLSWYEGVALSGLSSDSRASAAVGKGIIEDYSWTKCTSQAEKSIRGHISHEQR